MKYIIAFLLSTAVTFAATGDVQVKQKQASGAWKEVVIPATNSTLLGFNGSGVIGPASSATVLEVGTITLTTNTLPLPVGTVSMWATADIANKPTNTLVCDGANGTVNVTAPTGLTAIVVGNGTAATPTADVPAGTYTSTQTVTLSTATSGATILYTTNGDTVTSGSTAYSTPLSVASTTTVKAKSYKTLWAPSAEFSAAYTINTSTSYRYYRLYRAVSNTWEWGIAEFELFTATTAPSFPTPGSDLTAGLGGSAFFSGEPGGFGAANSIDDNVSTVWYSGPQAAGFVGVDLGTAQAVRSANVRTTDILAAGAIILQGSNNGTDYTNLATISTPANQTVYALSW